MLQCLSGVRQGKGGKEGAERPEMRPETSQTLGCSWTRAKTETASGLPQPSPKEEHQVKEPALEIEAQIHRSKEYANLPKQLCSLCRLEGQPEERVSPTPKGAGTNSSPANGCHQVTGARVFPQLSRRPSSSQGKNHR